MVRSKQFHIVVAVVVVGFLVAASAASAGVCKGRVVYKDGSHYANGGISGLVSGGGVTKKFYTDDKGRFTITWSSNKGLAKIYVKGRTIARDIKNGTTDLVLVVP